MAQINLCWLETVLKCSKSRAQYQLWAIMATRQHFILCMWSPFNIFAYLNFHIFRGSSQPHAVPKFAVYVAMFTILSYLLLLGGLARADTYTHNISFTHLNAFTKAQSEELSQTYKRKEKIWKFILFELNRCLSCSELPRAINSHRVLVFSSTEKWYKKMWKVCSDCSCRDVDVLAWHHQKGVCWLFFLLFRMCLDCRMEHVTELQHDL